MTTNEGDDFTLLRRDFIGVWMEGSPFQKEAIDALARIETELGDVSAAASIHAGEHRKVRTQLEASNERGRMVLEAKNEIIASLRTQLDAAREALAVFNTQALCVECGPLTGVDEDGLCPMCGATAMGTWLEEMCMKSRAALGPMECPKGDGA